MKKKLKFPPLFTAVFFLFCFGMSLLLLVLPKQTFSETEKRNLAAFPKFSFAALADGSFTRDFETFLSDQTPLRRFFVSLNAYADLALGNNGGNGVYRGRDGWLLEKPFARDNHFADNTGRIVRFAQKTTVPCAVMLVPTKGSVYTDKLPKNHLRYDDFKKIEAAQTACEKSGLRFVNIGERFLAEKDRTALYYKTDHHWTSAGAYLAYAALGEALGYEPTAADAYSVEKTPNFYGTSYARSGYTLTKPDSLEVWRSKQTGGRATVTIVENGKETKADNLFFADRLNTGDPYTVFLDGNHALETIETGADGGRLLVIKDSFAHCLVPFLAEHFSEIVTVDLRYYKKPVTALMSETAFDQVLFVYGADTFAENKIILR